MPTSREMIKKIQQKILQFEASQLSLSETETRRALIDPLFAAIGWDMGNPEVVRMEWRKKPDDKPVDYAFMVNGIPKLLVEAERLRDNLNDKKWENQLLWYSSKLGVKWCALTNGNIIRIYNSLAEEEAADKLLIEMEVKTIDTPVGLPIDVLSQKVSLLSENSLKVGGIDEAWSSIYAVRKVFDYLKTRKDNLADDISNNAKINKDSVYQVFNQIIKLEGTFLSRQETAENDIVLKYVPLFNSMDKPINYTGKKILSFWFNESTYEVNSWKDMLIKLSSIIGRERREEFANILEVVGKRRSYYSRDKDQLKRAEEILDTGIYAETNLSSLNIGVVIGKVIDKFGYKKSDVKIHLEA